MLAINLFIANNQGVIVFTKKRRGGGYGLTAALVAFVSTTKTTNT